MNKKIALLLCWLILAVMLVTAQGVKSMKADKIIFLNGTSGEGKVIAVADDKIRFVHTGETLTYEFNKKEIDKIEYGSGRTETLAPAKLPANSNLADNKNKVAVLPLGYTGDANSSKMEDMPFHLQEFVIDFLHASAGELKFQDGAAINAVLFRNGINEKNIRQYTPTELAALLGVEYLIMGSVMEDKGSQTMLFHSNNEERQKIENGRRDTKIMERSVQNGAVTNVQHITTNVSLAVYNAAGEKIYGKTRQSLWSDNDAYKYTLRYLLKRTPIYER